MTCRQDHRQTCLPADMIGPPRQCPKLHSRSNIANAERRDPPGIPFGPDRQKLLHPNYLGTGADIIRQGKNITDTDQC
jgi:hypothetical protein